MQILKTILNVRQWRKSLAKELKVGFVPTMGALHNGHLDLVKQARLDNDQVIVSIFVNPAQFAPTEDLDKYPRNIDIDLEKLDGLADAVFLPSVEEMYPSGITLDVANQTGTFVEVKGKSHVMEGSIRPHFFRGVATVGAKLLNIVQPTTLILGQKDAQQCVIFKSLIKDLCFDTNILVAPIAREPTGLAMSSRNAYLSQEVRQHDAVSLHTALTAAKRLYQQGITDRESLINEATELLKKFESAELEYLSLTDPWHLSELDQVGSSGAILSGAVRVGPTNAKIRIIDNELLGCQL